MEEMVQISRITYDNLRERLNGLWVENKNLVESMRRLEDETEQKVICKSTYAYEDEDGDIIEENEMCVKGFDEVKEEVEEFYKKKFEDLENEIKALQETIESQGKTEKALENKALALEVEVSRLKHRNLWQRIWNK